MGDPRIASAPHRQTEINNALEHISHHVGLEILLGAGHTRLCVQSAVRHVGIPVRIWRGFVEVCERLFVEPEDWKRWPDDRWQDAIHLWIGGRKNLRAFFVENRPTAAKWIDEMLEARRILEKNPDCTLDDVGCYRTMRVRVGQFVPPPPEEVSGLMFELLEWWNKEAPGLSPVLSSAIVHHRFETIHPFADGNGRTGRALALWELYRRGFDSHHIFAVDEFYWEDRLRYYAALDAVRHEGDDLTSWLEYCAEGLRQTLERVWERMGQFSVTSAREKLVLRPRQEQLLKLLGQSGGMTPSELWAALKVSKQGAMDLLRPLVKAGLVKRVGTLKTGRYVLK